MLSVSKNLSQIYLNYFTGSANNKSYNYRDENTIAELSSSYNSIHFVKGSIHNRRPYIHWGFIGGVEYVYLDQKFSYKTQLRVSKSVKIINVLYG